MPTNAERGRTARTQLLAAARELIGELGWHAVSTRVLAERAGVRSGLVHYHFESLQALLRQATIEEMHRMLDASAALLTDSPEPTATNVEAMLFDLDRYSGADPASRLFLEAYLAATRDPVLRDGIAELMTKFRAVVATSLASSGHPAPDDAAAVVLAVFDGFLLHKGLDPDLSAARIAPQLRLLTTRHPTPPKADHAERTT